MSDPVTNVEIEDVLESIRRLVAAGDSAGPVPPQRAQPRQDRLVLTPALRVDCSDTRPDDDSETAGPAPIAPPAKETSDRDDTTPTEWESRRDPSPQDATPSDSLDDSAGTDEVDRLLTRAMATILPLSARTLEPSERLDASLQDASDPALDWEDVEDDAPGGAEWPESGHDSPDDDQTATDPDDLPVASADPEDAVTEEPEEAGATTLWHSSRSTHHEEVEPATDPAHPTDPADTAPEPRDQAARRSDLEATIAELEAAVTFSAQDFEPDDPDTGIASPSSGRLHLVVTGDLDPQDDAGQDATAAPAVPPPEEPETSAPPQDDPPSRAGTAPRFRVYPDSAPSRDAEPAPGQQDNHIAARPDLDDDADLAAYLEDESVIDEEALRDLVGQIVREELQGVLGERITRNVRKLVRREIHRILSSQDFD